MKLDNAEHVWRHPSCSAPEVMLTLRAPDQVVLAKESE